MASGKGNVELARGYVSIYAVTDPSVGKEIDKIFGEVDKTATKSATTTGSKFGSNLISGINKTVNVGIAAVGGSIAGVLGTALTKGFSRLSNIESATAKLTGLGNSGEAVTQIMDNALASVRGTAFAMDEAAGAAATAVAAGIKPGIELEKYLKSVGDTAAITGGSMAEIGSIFGKVVTSGKAQRDVLNQLADRGFPIFTELQKITGKTGDEFDSMISRGEISTDIFLKAFESIQGAAQESGNTTTGAMANASAAMGRFGAVLLQDIYPAIQPLFVSIIGLFDRMTDGSKDIAGVLGTTVSGALEKVAKTLDSVDAEKMATGLGNILNAVLEIGSVALPILLQLTLWAADNAPLVVGLVAAWKGFMILQTISGVVTGLAAAFRVLGVAMLTTPVGLIITAVAALIGLIVLLVMNWDTVTAAVGNFVNSSITVLTGFFSWGTSVFAGFFGWLGEVMAGFWAWGTQVMADFWNGVGVLMEGGRQLFAGFFGWLGEVFTGFWSWGTGLFAGFWGMLGDGANAFGGGVAAVFDGVMQGAKALVNFLIGGINTLLDGVNQVGNFLRDASGGALSMGTVPNIPALASGGNVTSGGLALVGEAGVELVTGPSLMDLPRGAQVTPLTNDDFKQAVGTGSGATIIKSYNAVAERSSQTLARVRAQRAAEALIE